MQYLGKGTKCIKILLSQASKDMRKPLFRCFFPILSVHISGAEYQYPDLILKEPCGKMANRMSESGVSQDDLEVVPGQSS